MFSTDANPVVEGDVTFTVTDSSTLLPIENAEVTLDGVTSNTNASGQVVFADKTFGTYSYSVAKATYDLASGSVTVDAATEAVAVSLTLSVVPPTTGNVDFTVTDFETGSAISGASISIAGETDTTDANGEVTFSGIEAGEQLYVASATGYVTIFDTVTIVVDATQTEAVQLTASVPPSVSIAALSHIQRMIMGI
jgi:hypothetical protein